MQSKIILDRKRFFAELDKLQKAINEPLFLRMYSQLRAQSFIEEAGK